MKYIVRRTLYDVQCTSYNVRRKSYDRIECSTSYNIVKCNAFVYAIISKDVLVLITKLQMLILTYWDIQY